MFTDDVNIGYFRGGDSRRDHLRMAMNAKNEGPEKSARQKDDTSSSSGW
jgi:hypothetical protein